MTGWGWVAGRWARWGDVFPLVSPPVLPFPMFAFATVPDPIRQVLTDPSTFVKSSPVYGQITGVLGNGLLTSEGDEWETRRRTLQPLFTRRRVAA